MARLVVNGGKAPTMAAAPSALDQRILDALREHRAEATEEIEVIRDLDERRLALDRQIDALDARLAARPDVAMATERDALLTRAIDICTERQTAARVLGARVVKIVWLLTRLSTAGRAGCARIWGQEVCAGMHGEAVYDALGYRAEVPCWVYSDRARAVRRALADATGG